MLCHMPELQDGGAEILERRSWRGGVQCLVQSRRMSSRQLQKKKRRGWKKTEDVCQGMSTKSRCLAGTGSAIGPVFDAHHRLLSMLRTRSTCALVPPPCSELHMARCGSARCCLWWYRRNNTTQLHGSVGEEASVLCRVIVVLTKILVRLAAATASQTATQSESKPTENIQGRLYTIPREACRRLEAQACQTVV